jgi:hypothetical protein
MKKLTFALMAAVTAILTGCLVTSVCPFYTEKDLIFEAGLVGDWTNVKEADDHWKFERDGSNAYRLTYRSGTSTNVMQAHLFMLHGQSFLDLFTMEANDQIQPPPIPSHFLLRVVQLKPNVRMAPLDYGWLKETLTENPKALRHHVIKMGDKSDDDRIVLTADTVELQAFVIKQLKTKEAWKEDFELKRD